MARRSIHGHSRRRRNKRSALKQYVERPETQDMSNAFNEASANAAQEASVALDENSPMQKNTTWDWDKALMAGAMSTGDPVTMAVTKIIQDVNKRKDIEAETGRDFQRLNMAEAYKEGGATTSSAWEAVQEDLADTSSMFPPSSEL